MAYALLLLSTGSQLNGLYGPRIAIMLVLEGKYAQMISFLAPVCSSYSAVNVASSARSILTPLGRVTSTSVRRGNKMISRPGRAACPPETPISFSFTFISLLKGGARKRKRKKERERERERERKAKRER